MNGPQRVVSQARAMLGVPWRHQGRKPWAVDCAGLVVLSFAAAGWPRAPAAPARYGREPWDDMLRRTLREHFGEPLPADTEWQPGDVPLFRWGASEPTHVGVFGDHPCSGLSLIHASNRIGKVVEAALTDRQRGCVVEVYRPEWQEGGDR